MGLIATDDRLDDLPGMLRRGGIVKVNQRHAFAHVARKDWEVRAKAAAGLARQGINKRIHRHGFFDHLGLLAASLATSFKLVASDAAKSGRKLRATTGE